MKKTTLLRFALAFAFVGCTTVPVLAEGAFPNPQPTWTATDWSVFSENLVAGLQGDNEGVKLSALQMIVRYGKHLDVRDSQFEVVELFRSHPDRQVRRLAAIACRELKSEWAVGFLRMSEPFEKDERVRATIHSLVAEQD